jgi:collagenase-like PrtC family protease
LLVKKNTRVRVSNIGLLDAIKNSDRINRNGRYILLGSTLNISNTLSALFYDSSNPFIGGWEFSPEIDRFETADIINSFRKAHKGEYTFSFFGHGYFKIITARHRLRHSKKTNGSNSPTALKDRKNYKFKIKEDEAQNTNIYNSRKICTLFDLDMVIESGINDIVIDSIFIDPGKIEKLVKSYRKALTLLEKGSIENYKKHINNLKSDPLFQDYSRGHLLQGVE